MDTIIRNAVDDDIEAIIDIYNSTIASRKVTADTEPVTATERTPWFERHHSKRPLLVMEESQRVVGWLSFEDFYGRPAYSGTAELSLYIHADRRGRGLGDRLLRYAINQSLELDLHRLVAFIFRHNEPSIRLFQKFGFVSWGKLPGVAVMDESFYDLEILGLIL